MDMRFQLVQVQECKAKAVGIGTSNAAFIPFILTKIRSYFCVKEVSSFN